MVNNIKADITAGALLKNNDNYLLLLRSPNRSFAPNLWSFVGGHIEENELDDPFEACIREIKEEAGIDRKDIANLKLRYIILRKHKNIIRQSFVYFGETNVKELVQTDEGILHWVPKNELLNKEYTKTFMEMMKHYVNTPDLEENIIVGIAGKHENGLKMHWSKLEDFE